jgi:hypothetical protein
MAKLSQNIYFRNLPDFFLGERERERENIASEHPLLFLFFTFWRNFALKKTLTGTEEKKRKKRKKKYTT